MKDNFYFILLAGYMRRKEGKRRHWKDLKIVKADGLVYLRGLPHNNRSNLAKFIYTARAPKKEWGVRDQYREKCSATSTVTLLETYLIRNSPAPKKGVKDQYSRIGPEDELSNGRPFGSAQSPADHIYAQKTVSVTLRFPVDCR